MSDLEKLERLEQSITQLLYEVDANFSKCHRIITNNILPIVEKYADNSGQVWEHSKFWKQFFEASANVSLSGYEEQVNQGPEDTSRSMHQDESHSGIEDTRQSAYNDPPQGTDDRPFDLTGDEDASGSLQRSHLHSETPLHHDMESLDITSSPLYPSAPQTVLNSGRLLPDMHSQTPQSTPKLPPKVGILTGTPKSRNKNPLLHRVLDSNWKLQATPHSTRSKYSQRQERQFSTSPISSPPDTIQQLSNARSSKGIQTPSGLRQYEYDSEDDSSLGEMSPPVTMAFSLPASKLMRTPAKEAAKHMVDEILRTAGANDLSTIPSESPFETGDSHDRHDGMSESTFIHGSQGIQPHTRRLFDYRHGEEDTPIARKNAGVLDQWQESEEGSNWL